MTADEKMLFDTAAFIARTMPDSPTIIVDRTAILSAAAVIERAGDVEQLARLLASQPSTFTIECLSGPSAMLKWEKAKLDARAVSRFILEGK